MDLLGAFRSFIRVAESGSFSAVARELGTTQPGISRQIAALEEHLGARLIQRTTRSLTLTEDGRDLLAHAREVLAAVEETEAAIGRRRNAPAGLVRMVTPTTVGRLYIIPRVSRLLARFPELSLELILRDDLTDLVGGGFDLAIRAGAVVDASLVGRRIGSTARNIMAAASYIDRTGAVQHPSELAERACVIFTGTQAPHEWQFEGPGGTVAVRVDGRFLTSSLEAVREAVLAGLGYAVLPAWFFPGEIASGEIRRVLMEWQPARIPISAVYPSRRNLAPRTRAVIDFLVDEFRLDPVISDYGEA
jgi:DNA-binding transcriptional LysR family regulator